MITLSRRRRPLPSRGKGEGVIRRVAAVGPACKEARMKKVPTLFQRNHEADRLVRDEVTPGCEWVLDGEGTPTRKLDGTCCLIQGGKLYKRMEVKLGTPDPTGWLLAGVDAVTGKQFGWVPVEYGPEDKWHREGCAHIVTRLTPGGIYEPAVPLAQAPDGTYELLGPKVQRNPEGYAVHKLVRHGIIYEHECPRSFEALKEYLGARPAMEGIVWHRANGDMAKIKRKDFFER